MKKLLLLFLAIHVSIICAADGYVTINDITYGYVDKNWNHPRDYAYVKSCSSSVTGNVTIRSSISYDDKIYNVTSIDEKAFENCSSMISVNIPDGVTSIGNWAFYGCSSLISIIIPDGLTSIGAGVFSGCSSLTSINIPDGVTSIGNGAFSNCTNLQTVNISNSSKLDHFRMAAFSDCSSLTSINIPDGVTYIGEWAFSGCANLQIASISNNSKLESIDQHAFENCSGLTSINIPDGVTSIDDSAFRGCSSLTSIIIPDGMTNICRYTFYGCTNLQAVSISNNSKLENIGNSAFHGCSSLTSINIPDGVKNIGYVGGEGCFGGCTNLQTVNISNDSKLEIIGDGAFYNCSSLTSINIPDGVTSIGSGAFSGCTSLQTVSISNNSKLETFGSTQSYSGAFQYCKSLTSINIPDGMKSIGGDTFYGCTNLQTVNISNNSKLENIAHDAFCYCSSLESFMIPANVETVGVSAFSNCSNISKLSFYCKNVGKWFSSSNKKVEEILIGNSVETIKESSFKSFSSLTNLKFEDGSSLKEIEMYAFRDCDALKEVDLPEPLETLGNHAFYSCGKLETIKLPKTLKTIHDNAFINCSALKDVYAYMLNPFQINVDVFSTQTYKDATLHVNGVADKYRETYAWSKFFHVINIGETPGEGDGGDDSENPVPGHHHESVTITANSYTINYGDELPEYGYTTTGAALNGTPEITCEATKTSPVGTYPIVVSKGTITNTKTTFVNGTLTVTKAPLTIKASNYTKVEGEENPAFTLTYEGFKNNETSDVLTKQPAVSCSATKDSPAGDYPVTVSGAEAQNYEISYVAGTLTVTADSPELNDGDVFTAMNADGVEMTFQVISAADKTCQVVRQGKDSHTIVTRPVPESITIPAEAKGFKVISIGYQAFYGAKGIKSVIIPEGVTSINTQAFRECYNLASITFPTSLEECGTGSFEDCAFGATVHISDLESWCNVSLPSWDLYGWHLFLNGEEVKDLVIPNGVTSIGESMALVSPLTNCASLTSVTIPASVTKMYAPFSGCSSLTSVTTFAEEPVAIFTGFPNATNSITNATLYVPKGSKAAYEAADYWKDFKEILEIEDETPEDIITFADPNVKAICVTNWDTNGDGKLSKTEATAVTSLGDVFMGNSEITSFDELQYFTGLTTIPDNAFSGCGSLKSIRLPKSLTSIGEYAFEDCTSLETVVSFIETPFELGEGAFCAWESYDGGNDWLKYNLHFSLYVPVGTKGLYRAAGWDVDESYGDYRTILSGTPENPGSFTIDGIVYDPIDATTVELIDGKNASGDVTIPSMVANSNVGYQVTEIGACAFKGNTSLTSIVIPNCVKAIRPFAFNGCTGLTTVISYIETPFSLGALKGVFLNNENVVYATYLQFTLYVPAGTKSLYEQASWTDASRIVEMGGDAYAVFDSTTGTLTFKCGEKPSGDNVYDAISYPGWKSQMTKVKKVVFDNSFALARPTSTASWFAFEPSDDSSQFTEVVGIHNLNTSNVTNMSYMFSRCRSLTSLDVSHFDTSNVTDMNSMFFYSGLTSLDLSHFNTSNVTNMYHMFGDCSSLTSLDVSSFDTHNVQNMGGMFSGCKVLTHINVDNFDTGNVSSMMQMFCWCESLTSLDLRQFNTANVTDMYMMFYVCSNLTSICVSDKWSTEKITKGNNMFGSCDKLVGGKGTKYDYNHSDYTYAHIDGGKDNPGYFTSAGKLGDANDDGYVNMTDVNAVKDYLMEGKTEGFQFFNADANGDKVVNAADIVKIINIIKSNSSSGGDVEADVEPDISEDPSNEDL